MKNIEEFIKNNREAFDSYEPGERVWKALESNFPESETRRPQVTAIAWMRWIAVAAIVLFLLAGVYYFSRPVDQISPDAVVQHHDIPAEYAEEVYHFTRLIGIKQKELNKLKKEEPELYKKFSTDIRRLDSSYQMLKTELPGNPNEELVLEAMIENLRIQIDLLNEQLSIIQKIKQTKNRDNGNQYKST